MTLKPVLFVALLGLGISYGALAEESAPPATTAQSEIDPALLAAVDTYMKTWQAKDYNAMHGLENWEGGDAMAAVDYVATYDPYFEIYQWTVTRAAPQEDGTLKLLVLTTHNPPKQVMQYLPAGKKVNTTLLQWWKKTAEGYQHLYHIEKRKREALMAPPKVEGEIKLPDALQKSAEHPEHDHEKAGAPEQPAAPAQH